MCLIALYYWWFPKRDLDEPLLTKYENIRKPKTFLEKDWNDLEKQLNRSLLSPKTFIYN